MVFVRGAIEGIHTASEESIAWRVGIGIDQRRPTVFVVAEHAFVHTNHTILLHCQTTSAFLLCLTLVGFAQRARTPLLHPDSQKIVTHASPCYY